MIDLDLSLWPISHYLLFSYQVVSDSLWPHELQYTWLPYPSLPSGVCSKSSPLSWWSSNYLFLCCPLLLLNRRSFIFPSIKVIYNPLAFRISWSKCWSFSFSISPSNNIQGWFPFRLTCWISLQSKGLSKVLSSTTVQKHQFFGSQPSIWFNSHIHTWLLEKS